MEKSKDQKNSPRECSTRIALALSRQFEHDTGLRSLFRRWQPAPDALPDLKLAMAAWKTGMEHGIFPEGTSQMTLQNIANRAAVLAAVLAQYEKPGSGEERFGAALFKAGVSEPRLARLLSSPDETRQEGFLRVHQLIARKGIVPQCDWKSCLRYYDFLFYSDRWAVEKWAGEYFQSEFQNSN